MKLSADQVRKYFEARLSQSIPFRAAVVVRCPFHDDSTASLSINLDKGVWKCHAGCGDGGLIDFEVRMNGGSREDAAHRIDEILGADHLFESQRTKPVAIYQYLDAQGHLVFEKLRYEPKRFVQRRMVGNGHYEYKLEGIQKPLYRLPELLRATQIFICEGEKDADNVKARFTSEPTIAATTNFGGAGKWKPEDSIFFAGKRVVVLVDNDDVGRKHAEMVAQSVRKLAVGVKLIELPGLAAHGDVSDWLAAGHTTDELIAEIRKTPQWKPKETPHVELVETTKLVTAAPAEVDWLIKPVIPKGANGVVTGEPKAGKSLVVIDQVMALSTGTPWLGFDIPRRVKCALISREDYPGMTAQRFGGLYRGTSRPDFEGWSWCNTRWQTPTFSLENDDEVNRMIAELQMESIEFAVLDVFRRIHSADENDNTEMQKILDQLSRIQREVGCALALVHHLSKGTDGRIFRRARGASAIDGWTEWAMAVTVTNPEQESQREWIRKIEFETKAASAADPVYFQIESTADTMRLNAVPGNSLGVKL